MAREKWCCPSMQTAYAERRDRTIFVYADPPDDDGEVRFWLATRAMTFEALAEDPPPVIPPHLAYGEEGTGTVPPNAVVVSEIEVLGLVLP